MDCLASNDRPEVQGIERSGMSGSSLHPASNDRPEVQGIESHHDSGFRIL